MSMPPDKILTEAASTLRQRGAEYDGKGYQGGERSMAHTVQIFNTITGRNLTEREGWLLMLSLKIARSMTGKPKLDTYVDLAGYSALLGEAALLSRGADVTSSDQVTP